MCSARVGYIRTDPEVPRANWLHLLEMFMIPGAVERECGIERGWRSTGDGEGWVFTTTGKKGKPERGSDDAKPPFKVPRRWEVDRVENATTPVPRDGT